MRKDYWTVHQPKWLCRIFPAIIHRQHCSGMHAINQSSDNGAFERSSFVYVVIFPIISVSKYSTPSIHTYMERCLMYIVVNANQTPLITSITNGYSTVPSTRPLHTQKNICSPLSYIQLTLSIRQTFYNGPQTRMP